MGLPRRCSVTIMNVCDSCGNGGVQAAYHAFTQGRPCTAIKTMTTTSPLLNIGTFGTHLIGDARGYSFAGDVPCDIEQGGYATESDGIAAFVEWFRSQDLEFQHAHAADLRNDVFCLMLAG